MRWLHRAWRYRLGSNAAEIRFVRTMLNQGDLAVDLGVHKGGYLYWLRKTVGATGQVVGFEPQQRLLEKVRLLSCHRGWSNVKLECLAVSDKAGLCQLGMPPGKIDSPGARLISKQLEDVEIDNKEWSTTSVQAVTLDDYFANRKQPVRFIKCDVEGEELNVFNGSLELLKTDSPILMFECEERHLRSHSVSDVFDLLHSFGYQGQFFSSNGILPLKEFSLTKHQSVCEGNIVDTKSYCNNFAFVKS